MTQPTGGNWKASIVAIHVGLGAGLGPVAGRRWSDTAATLADPLKLTQPCMVVPDKTKGP